MFTIWVCIALGLVIVAASIIEIVLTERKNRGKQEYNTWLNAESGDRRKMFEGDEG